jgi:glycosyltransferase involved in cell wall biosynthesis
MKIGIISTTQGLSWAATDEVWFRLAVVAAKKGHTIIAAIDKSLEIKAQIPLDLKPSIQLFTRRRSFRPTRVFLAIEKILSSFSQIENKSDIIIINGGSIFDGFNQPEILQFAKKCRVPLIFFCHGHSEFYPVVNRKGLRDFLARMKGMVFVAEENQRTIENQLAVKFSNAFVVRNSASFILSDPLPWPDSLVPQLAIVARLDSYWKGHEVLFRILAQEPWKNREWILRCYGEGADNSFLEDLILHLGLQDKVKLCGYINNIQDVWKTSQILLLPTKAESFSLAMLEAMMCGRPVITTNVGDHGVIIKNGETGWLADVGTPSSFALALESAWQNRETWEETGRNSFQIVNNEVVCEGPEALLDAIFKILKK